MTQIMKIDRIIKEEVNAFQIIFAAGEGGGMEMTYMSCFNEDRATFNVEATDFDKELSDAGFDEALLKAFNAGMNLDELMYVVNVHTERVVRRYIVQHQLKKAANKEK